MHPIRWSINRKLQQIRPKFTNLRNQCDSHNRAANIKYSIPYIGTNPPSNRSAKLANLQKIQHRQNGAHENYWGNTISTSPEEG